MKARPSLVLAAVSLLIFIIGVFLRAQPRGRAKGTCETWVTCSESRVPRYRCFRVNLPIKLDGRLAEPAWLRAEVFRSFMLTNGEAVPTHSTEFRAVWSSTHLYLAFTSTDPKLLVKHSKRDATVYEDDCVEAFLSSGRDQKRYFEFEFNPRNAQMDASVVFQQLYGDDKVVDYTWDCAGLKTATRTKGKGANQRWTIEIALPFSSIGREGKSPTIGQTWRANFYRIDYGGRVPEFICWSPTILDPPSFHVPARFGRFVFLSTPARRLRQ